MLFKDYVSTGEAAKILNISRSTISRRFDSGLLRGKLNPITGERLISRDSLYEFIQEHDLPIKSAALQRGKVIVVSPRHEIERALKDAFRADPRMEILAVEQGADALILCSQNPPALLVVDAALADIGAGHVIQTLRRREELRRTRILAVVADGSGEQAAQLAEADRCMTLAELGAVNGADAVYRLVGLGPQAERDHPEGTHYRRWSRYPVNVPVRIGIYRLSAPREHSWGRAMMRNISRGGAYISRIELDNKSLPAEPFRMLLEIEADPLSELKAHCQVVRMKCNGSLSAGLQFVRISKSGQRKIAALSRGLVPIA